MSGIVLASPGSIFLQLGPITIRWYGLMFALGFVACAYTATRLGKQFGFRDEDVINATLASFVGGVVGARLYFVALSWQYFQSHLLEIGATWLGGLSIHGGLIGATIGIALFCRRNKLAFPSMIDLLSSVIPLGQAVGRWGNFFNSELFGGPVSDSFPIKVFIPEGNRPIIYKNCSYFHPAFLYECIWDFLLFLVLYCFVFKKCRNVPFLTTLIYIAGYSIGRLLIEPMRTDSIMVNSVQAPMVASAVCLAFSLLGIVGLLLWKRRFLPAGQDKEVQSPD